MPVLSPRDLLVLIAAGALFGAVVALAIASSIRRRARSGVAVRRAARAIAGERDAMRLLRASGFEILGAQVASTYDVVVDGVKNPISVRADYLVAKAGCRFVAEVKTGVAAPRIDTSATRRQLLEYLVAFEAAGVLLVDADAASIHAVEFPIAVRQPVAKATPSFGLGLVFLAAVTLVAFALLR